MDDVIVTLLDGTKIPKSKVPVDTVYINENGVKVKKVVKQVAKPDSQGFSFGSFLRKAADAADEVSKTASETAYSVKDTVSKTFDTVCDSASSVYDSMCELAVLKIKDILNGVDFQEIMNSIDKYEKESSKNVSSLKEFVKRLKTFSDNGD